MARDRRLVSFRVGSSVGHGELLRPESPGSGSTPLVGEESLGNLKFGECLPLSLAREVFVARFNDPGAIANVRRQSMRVVASG